MDEWVRYFRDGQRPVEAMHAHFERHRYHRHSHDTYSFGVTESGAQSFTCRGGAHTSATGLVMAFNPDEPHDGWSATPNGFTYRIVHIGPSVMADVLADFGGPAALPLFDSPVVDDTRLAAHLAALHAGLLNTAEPLRRDELLTAALFHLVRVGATRPPRPSAPKGGPARALAAKVRSVLDHRYAEPLTADDLALAAGASRYAVYRAFTASYGMSPSDYQRQLRLRQARALLAAGRAPVDVAAEVGFADQAHLTRWFLRTYGITPGTYRLAS